MEKGIEITGKNLAASPAILTDDALAFVAALHRTFNPTRERLLARRGERQLRFDAGTMPDFLPETADVRKSDWKVAPTPPDLQKRWVEITGPVERKMMINAFNSGASVFMADFEDSLSPTWENVVEGQQNLVDAVRRTIEFQNPDGKAYRLNAEIAVLLVRPRGWHLVEKHILIDCQSISASILDFGLYFFHNAAELKQRNSGPYFYLPKMESHLEARLWNDVFNAAQDALHVPRGTIRATVLVETLPAAFEMDEILYELREHASGLNAGRWDYIFSLIKKFRRRADLALPDRVQVTMTVPFMRAYTDLLVRTCHRRGAHAMGGMAPFIPNRKNPEINEKALAKVRDDKTREAGDGFDGTWVAHPDLVPVAMEVFQAALGRKANQKEVLRPEVNVAGAQLVDTHVPGGTITEGGFRNNVSVALQYLATWLSGNGAVAIFNLMEDAATAEISRAQLWQWITNKATLDDGTVASRALYERIREEELEKLGGRDQGRMHDAVELLDSLVINPEFTEFLTLPAYRLFE
ncbi:MAG TPA: malate synthase A [Thermoanaerobaculia bacterium]|nr:malate synthase A [Thermoanaerobaculia bacterium]